MQTSLPLAAGTLALALGLAQSPAPPSLPLHDAAVDGVPDAIDFEALQPGEIVDAVFSVGGAGPILVSGSNPALAGQNAAVVFDSANPTGGDFDLGTPNETCDPPGPGVGVDGEVGGPFENCVPQGNVLIVAEDLVDVAPADGLVDDPDDANLVGCALEFDFAALGSVSFCGITVIDIEADEPNAEVVLTFSDLSTTVLPLPQTGDNGTQTLSVPCGVFDDVIGVRVELNGSGAIDELVFQPTPPEACHPCLDVILKCLDGDPGEPITYLGRVINCGDVDLENVTAVHDNGTPLDPGDDTVVVSLPLLPAGDKVAFFGTYEPTVPPGTPSTSTVAAVGTPPESCGLPDLTAEASATCVQEPPPGEGCTPGFWKNHPELWDDLGDPVAAAAGFTTDTSFNAFLALTPAESGFPDSLSMLDALNVGGGGPFKLARHGVAALLSVAAGLDYQLPPGIESAGELAAALHDAYVNDVYEPLATELEQGNEAGCPL